MFLVTKKIYKKTRKRIKIHLLFFTCKRDWTMHKLKKSIVLRQNYLNVNVYWNGIEIDNKIRFNQINAVTIPVIFHF